MAVLSESEGETCPRKADYGPDMGTLQSFGFSRSFSSALGRPSSAPALQRPVQEILDMRRRLDTEGVPYCRSMDFNHSFRDLQSSLQEVCRTRQYEEFCRRVKIQAARTLCPGCSVKTFFDLKCYVVKNEPMHATVPSAEKEDFKDNVAICEPGLHNPGGLMLIYAFYVQLYGCLEKVHDNDCINGWHGLGDATKATKAEQAGILQPVDPNSQLTYLDMLHFACDFEIIPKLITRVQLQTAYGHVHPGKYIDDKFVHSGLTLHQFTELLIIIADLGYNDVFRYKLVTKLERVKRLIEFLNLADVNRLKEALSDIWWRRSRSIQRFVELGSVVGRERENVKPGVLAVLPPERHIEYIADEPAFRSLTDLTFVPQLHKWSAFKSIALDMGIMRIGTYYNFRILVKNETSRMMDFSLTLFPLTSALSIHKPDHLKVGVAPGSSWDVMIIAHPLDESEWQGLINIHGKNHNGEQYAIQIPGYLRGVGAKNKHPRVGLLPKKVPGAIHRRGDSTKALLGQDLTPGVLIKECIGLPNAGAVRPMGGVIAQRKMLSRQKSHGITHSHMTRLKSHFHVPQLGRTL